MTDLHFRSAVALAGLVKTGEVGARELLEHFLERVDRYNPAINAIVVEDRAGARARADAADAARVRGDALGPLHGVPMTIKESYDWTGTPATWGIPEMKGNIARSDALAVQRLTAAGVNVFGKTNVPIRLADFQSYNEIYGVTGNPWDLGRTPGGSSGGSAAAIAAGLTGLEIGTDIGGSIRNPAHYCGVFGHKPTWNLCPTRGHSPSGALTPPDISVIGPLARSAADLRATLLQIAGPDLLEAGAVSVDLRGLDKPLSRLRVGVWTSDPLCAPSKAVVERVEAVAAALAAEGAEVDLAARPAFEARDSDFVFCALLFSAMANRMPEAMFADLVAKAEALDADDNSPRAWQLRWQTMRARDWAGLNERRTKLRWAWRDFFEDYDVLITPIMPTTAFPHDHQPEHLRKLTVDGVERPYSTQLFWAGLAGVAHLPATIIPTGPAADGLPIGVQLIGPLYGDMKLIDLAERLEGLGFGFKSPPGYA
jgi:amidase